MQSRFSAISSSRFVISVRVRPIVRDNDIRPLGGKMLDRAPHEGHFTFKPREGLGGGVAIGSSGPWLWLGLCMRFIIVLYADCCRER